MKREIKPPVKLGVAFGSGGIKGMAHIGAIRAFEEEGIKFDIVAGTSIGSVVGALYARGYTSSDLSRLKSELLSIGKREMIVMTLGGYLNAMRTLIGDASFDDLSMPFAAIATDVDSGEEVVMREGPLATALAGSCAVPPFPPVTRNGRTLVDGAYVNYVPSDAVKDLGADVVVGINLGKGSDSNVGIKAMLDKTYPENGVKVGERSAQYYRFSDVCIEPDLRGNSRMGLKSLEDMEESGYFAAKACADKIKKFLY